MEVASISIELYEDCIIGHRVPFTPADKSTDLICKITIIYFLFYVASTPKVIIENGGYGTW